MGKSDQLCARFALRQDGPLALRCMAKREKEPIGDVVEFRRGLASGGKK